MGAQAPPAAAVSVTAKPPAVLEGQGFAATVANFTDGFGLFGCTSPGQYSATITWGDGAATAGTVTGGVGMLLGGCLYAVDASHTYAEEGRANLSVSVTGPSGANDSGPAPVAVRDAPLTASGTGFTASQNTAAAATVATFADANPGATISDFTATIVWGDGATSAGAVAAAPGGGFAVTASHTYPRAGTFSATATIKDAGGSEATAAATATVTAAPGRPPVATAPPPPAPLRLGLSTPVLARGGTVVVGVRCPVAARTCRGRLSVATVAAPRSALPALRRAQALGTTLFIIPGGRQAQISVRPKRAVVALLRRAGTVRVSAAASSFDASGHSQVATLTGNLRLPRPGR